MGKNWNPKTGSEDIQSRCRDGICHRKMCHANYKKRETTHVHRKGEETGLTSIQESVNALIQRLEYYIKKRGGRLIKASWNNTDSTSINRTKITWKQKREEKQLYGYFKLQTGEISHEKTWTWLRKGNHWRETESLQIAPQNNAIRTNCIKARIDKTQQNSWCRLCGDRDATMNHIISECNKLALREFKTRHDWVGKVIHWELCKNFKFDHTNKWYMHNSESVPENETYKILWDFEIQTDHQISASWPDLVIVHKK